MRETREGVYEKVVVNDREVVEVQVTEHAKRHILAWALPETAAVVLARPTLARPTGVGHALTAYRMPIEGRDEWIAAVERLA